MYTELQFSAEINYKRHSEILDVLKYMTGDEQVKSSTLRLPNHSLFETNRWKYMLRSSSAYFAGQPQSVLYEEHASKLVSLTVLCSLKNYSQEIEKFLDWIRPYVLKDYIPEPESKNREVNDEPRLFVGHVRYEEDVDPEFIYFTKDQVKFVKPQFNKSEDEPMNEE